MQNDHERHELAAMPSAEAPTADAANPPPQDQILDRRVQKLMDYTQSSLEKPDPLQACLSAANADLLRISSKLGSAIDAALAGKPTELAEYEEVFSSIDCLLRINKQIDCFARLDLRLTSLQAAVATAALPTTVSGKQNEKSAI